MTHEPAIGFIGLGLMGLPIALNLARDGQRIHAWNRTSRAAESLKEAGGIIANNPGGLLAMSRGAGDRGKVKSWDLLVGSGRGWLGDRRRRPAPVSILAGGLP